MRSFEGFKPTRYYIAGIPHIGYGFNLNVWPGLADPITQEQAVSHFEKIVAETYEPIVRAALKRPVSQREFEALVSFVYNTGTASQQLFSKVNNKAPDIVEFWENWYTTSNGIELPGLRQRRKKEAAHYASGVGLGSNDAGRWWLWLIGLGVVAVVVKYRNSKKSV